MLAARVASSSSSGDGGCFCENHHLAQLQTPIISPAVHLFHTQRAEPSASHISTLSKTQL